MNAMHHHATAPKRLQTLLTLLIACLLAAFATGCADDDNGGANKNPGDPTNPPITRDYSLRLAPNCDALAEQIINVTTEQALQYRYLYWGRELAAGGDATAGPPSSNSGSAAPTDFTTTNVQEQGVDELDIVKTDGSFIYTVRENKLIVLKSWPATEVGELSRVTLFENSPYEDRPDGTVRDYTYGWARGLFLKGDRVIAISDIYEYSYDAQGNWRPDTYFYGTRLTIIDVSNRAQPRVVSSRDVEGYLSDARMIDGDVYTVTNGGIRLPEALNVWSIAWREDIGLPSNDYDFSDREEQRRRVDEARPILRQHIAAALAGLDIASTLPVQRAADGTRAPMFQCNDIYLPSNDPQLGVLTLSHVNIDANDVSVASTGVLASGWTVYSSRENLYVSMSSGGWWWGWWWGQQENTTHIHKFDLTGGANGTPAYAASGRVDGWLLNQFSMSEHNGYLRVATTDSQWTWDEATQTGSVTGGNHLTVLQEANGALNEVGAVRDLAPGERIFSARMMGDKGYLVTFEQVDPLFTFDLSDPTNPRLLGELKIDGFSSYMHPVGDNHLLTIGQDATPEGRVLGVHLQVFDVSDLTNPTRTFHQQISTGDWSSWSEALWDHHAFTYHAGKEVLAFPVNIYNYDEATQTSDHFSGLLVYRASVTTGFQEIGRVAHDDLVTQRWCEEYNGTDDCRGVYYHWWTNMRRSIFIEDFLYSLSDVGLKVNELLNPSNELVAIPLY
jgi:uncharacterized secreted protein with C-terminal beta-propeller domain